MENCIYHSADLDGLCSAAIIKTFKDHYEDEIKLHGFDYGETIDIRKFKGKRCTIIDVSLPIERMDQLGQHCTELIWIDHHVSAFNDLMSYCDLKKYEIVENKINSFITRYQINKMNLNYYYSNIYSACEIALEIYGSILNQSSKKIVSLLGQYDTWRNNQSKMLFKDKNWEKIVLPFQYGMRAFKSPEEICKLFRTIDYDSDYSIDEIADKGSYVLDYQKTMNERIVKNNSNTLYITFKKKEYCFIAVNTPIASSKVFDGVYFPQLFDGMLCYSFDLKKMVVKFSLYTEEEESDILAIAKSQNGGGHAQACGFSIPISDFKIDLVVKDKTETYHLKLK